MKRRAKFSLAVLLMLTLSGSVWADGFFTYWQSPQQLSDPEKQSEERLPEAAPFLDAYFSNLQVEVWHLDENYAPLGTVVGENDTTSPETVRYQQKETVITKGKWTALLDHAALRKQVQQWSVSQLGWVAQDQVTFAAREGSMGTREGSMGTLTLSPGMSGGIRAWQSALEIQGSFLLQRVDREGTVYEVRRVPFAGTFPLSGFHLENWTK